MNEKDKEISKKHTYKLTTYPNLTHTHTHKHTFTHILNNI